MPKFRQLQLLYPGWKHHGGLYNDHDILAMIGSNNTRDFTHLHNTASLRMSWTLNRYGGRHSIGREPVYLSGVTLGDSMGQSRDSNSQSRDSNSQSRDTLSQPRDSSNLSRDSMTGSDGVEYIYRNTAFGPYLASRYGDPTMIRQYTKDVSRTMSAFEGRQGIVRFVSYHGDHAGGHIALWDCGSFHQSRDFTDEHNVIAVEFWETPGELICFIHLLTLLLTSFYQRKVRNSIAICEFRFPE